MVYYRIDEFIAQGDAVVARGSTSWTNKKTGKTAETPKVDFWRFRDGKALSSTNILIPRVSPPPQRRNKRVAILLRPAQYIGQGEHDDGY